VIAYKAKGPKDIIEDGVCGFTVNTEEQMIEKIIRFLGNPKQQESFRKAAAARAKHYDVDRILEQFMTDVGLRNCQ